MPHKTETSLSLVHLRSTDERPFQRLFLRPVTTRLRRLSGCTKTDLSSLMHSQERYDSSMCVLHNVVYKENSLQICLIFTARCTIVQSAVLRSHVVCTSVCLSVCLSVTLVDQDHIGWKFWKLIERTLSLRPSLFVAKRPSTYAQGNVGNF